MMPDPRPTSEEQETIAALRAENEKLAKINRVLMDRVERSTDWQGNAFSLFQAAIVLEGRVEERTIQLESALRQMEALNHDLSQAKEASETAQKRLQEGIDSISEGFALFNADDQLVLWNDNFIGLCTMLGSEIHAGTRFVQIIRDAVNHDTIKDAIGRKEAWLAERLAAHLHPGRPFVYRLQGGRWVQVNERRTHDGGTVAVYTDITEIKLRDEQRRQRELAAKSELLQATLESLSQGVAVFDNDLRLVVWNQRFIDLHRFPAALAREGAHYAEFIWCNAKKGEYGQGDLEAIVAQRIEIARTQSPRQFERTLSDGTIVEVANTRMPDGGFVNTYTDITERKRAEEKLRESERRLTHAAFELSRVNEGLERRVEDRTAALVAVNEALHRAKIEAEQANVSKTKFLAAASHDLHQPLNAARLFIAALAERGDWVKDAGELILGIDNSLEAIDGLLRTLFEISKLDAGVQTTELADLSVGQMFAQMAREYLPQARERGLDLVVVQCSLVVRSDARLLARVLRNFLSNALRYTETGRILLGCRRTGDSVRIEVWDSGLGIPENKLADVFDEFQQIALPGRRRDKGMGLGLAIVDRIARLLKHPLRVTSTLGKGSCFSIQVPVSTGVEILQPADQVAPAANRGNFTGMTVVAIDDDPTGLDALAALLGAWQCKVVPIHSPAELETWLADGDRTAPHVVIADYHLGHEVVGPMLIDRIRSFFAADIPAFVVTSDRDPAVKASLKAVGLTILNKPIPPARLRALMTHLLKRDPGL